MKELRKTAVAALVLFALVMTARHLISRTGSGESQDTDDLSEDVRMVKYSEIVTGSAPFFDGVLQSYGTELMRSKYGALVALDPSTGEILAGVSAPDEGMFDLIRPLVRECEDIACGRCRTGLLEEMWLNVNAPPGTGARVWSAHVDGLDICGDVRSPENPEDSCGSVFLGFAPKDCPKIAIVVYIENARHGGTYAAPIGSLMIEKYLRGGTGRPDLERRMKSADLVSRAIYGYQ